MKSGGVVFERPPPCPNTVYTWWFQLQSYFLDHTWVQDPCMMKLCRRQQDYLHGVLDKYEFIATMDLVEQPERIQQGMFAMGLRLGRQLQQMDGRQRWKLLADFWADMLIFCAPSDNVDAHIRRLSQGGEFITHLWALLSHAGILKRPSDLELESDHV